MRRWLWAAAVTGAAWMGAACGGGGGGGGGGTVGTTSTGTVLTATGSLAFTAGNSTAVSGSTSCQAAGVSYGLAFAAVIASDQTGICGYLQRSQDKASARSIRIALFKTDPKNPTAATITAGTYPVMPSPVVPSLTTQTTFAFVSIDQNDATCKSTIVSATTGTVTVTSTTGGQLQGTLNVNLSDGGTITGSIAAADCAVTFPGDLCAGELGPLNPTCAP